MTVIRFIPDVETLAPDDRRRVEGCALILVDATVAYSHPLNCYAVTVEDYVLFNGEVIHTGGIDWWREDKCFNQDS